MKGANGECIGRKTDANDLRFFSSGKKAENETTIVKRPSNRKDTTVMRKWSALCLNALLIVRVQWHLLFNGQLKQSLKNPSRILVRIAGLTGAVRRRFTIGLIPSVRWIAPTMFQGSQQWSCWRSTRSSMESQRAATGPPRTLKNGTESAKNPQSKNQRERT